MTRRCTLRETSAFCNREATKTTRYFEQGFIRENDNNIIIVVFCYDNIDVRNVIDTLRSKLNVNRVILQSLPIGSRGSVSAICYGLKAFPR
jgi:hypothetical protein